MNLWRISNYRTLSGEGGLHHSARWHTAGNRIVYLAESPAGAFIEVLVHLELDETDWPPAYDLLQIEAPSDIVVESLDPTASDADWKISSAITRHMGDEWLRSGRSALARVPSAILPSTWNFLLNPKHPDADRIQIVEAMHAKFDLRLFPKLR